MDKEYLIDCKKAALEYEQEALAKVNDEMAIILDIIVRLEAELDELGAEYSPTFTPVDWDEFDLGESLN